MNTNRKTRKRKKPGLKEAARYHVMLRADLKRIEMTAANDEERNEMMAKHEKKEEMLNGYTGFTCGCRPQG